MVKKNNQPICETSPFGTKYWYLDEKIHREDGPAIEYIDGSKTWCLYDQCHRIDGPAVEYANGYNAWYYHGEYINCFSQKEFKRLLKLKILW